jgi:hypothetical protein
VLYLTTLLVVTDYRRLVGWLVSNELADGRCRGAVVVEGLNKATERLRVAACGARYELRVS